MSASESPTPAPAVPWDKLPESVRTVLALGTMMGPVLGLLARRRQAERRQEVLLGLLWHLSAFQMAPRDALELVLQAAVYLAQRWGYDLAAVHKEIEEIWPATQEAVAEAPAPSPAEQDRLLAEAKALRRRHRLRDSILACVGDERTVQEQRFSDAHDDALSLDNWLDRVTAKVSQAMHEAPGTERVQHRLIEAAAVLVAAVESQMRQHPAEDAAPPSAGGGPHAG